MVPSKSQRKSYRISTSKQTASLRPRSLIAPWLTKKKKKKWCLIDVPVPDHHNFEVKEIVELKKETKIYVMKLPECATLN